MFLNIRPKDHLEPHNKVGSLSLAKCQVGSELESTRPLSPNYFSVLFEDCGNLFFDEKIFKILYLFSFYPKNSRTCSKKNFHNSGVVGPRKLADPSLNNVFNFPLIRLQDTLSFKWPDFGLKYLVTVMLKGQPPKFKGGVQNFPISETGSECNLTC